MKAGFVPERPQMLDLSFDRIGPNTYRKWNPILRVRTTLTFDRANGKIHVRHDQPRALIEAVLERNVALQNGAKSSRSRSSL